MGLDNSLETKSFIEHHPMVQELRQSGKFLESKGYEDYPQHLRHMNLTAGPLTGPQKISVAPYIFTERTGGGLIVIFYLGTHVAGYPGIVHGGLLATILDEGLGWSCFPSLPGKAGATVSITVDYLSPMPTGSFGVLKAWTTSVVERKAWAEGFIETLPAEGPPVIVAKARALFVAPSHMTLMAQ
ncbi:HotDog domain-containing protein [Penicillium verhagenii]|nr:HotDog domain-containing protein [Penicillium verhagenii]